MGFSADNVKEWHELLWKCFHGPWLQVFLIKDIKQRGKDKNKSKPEWPIARQLVIWKQFAASAMAISDDAMRLFIVRQAALQFTVYNLTYHPLVHESAHHFARNYLTQMIEAFEICPPENYYEYIPRFDVIDLSFVKAQLEIEYAHALRNLPRPEVKQPQDRLVIDKATGH